MTKCKAAEDASSRVEGANEKGTGVRAAERRAAKGKKRKKRKVKSGVHPQHGRTENHGGNARGRLRIHRLCQQGCLARCTWLLRRG